MTGAHGPVDPNEELARAHDCLREAQLLHDASLSYGATSRAYYAAFHGARSLLFAVGLEPRSHRAVVSMVSEHYVKPGRLPTELGRLLAHMQRDREDADYDPGVVLTEAESAQALVDAARFLGAVESLLRGATEPSP